MPDQPTAPPTNSFEPVKTKFGILQPVSIVKEMQQSYLDYAMSVIVSRALPDVRDGLKPVHRRILFSMFKSGIHHSSSYKKSARIVGDVLGRYHPHGDSPVYMALVRLAQEFSMRYPLIDGQGNFGSIDGDSPAAMRYTEARLAKISQELLADLDKNTVPFADNFDGSIQEPTVLPTKLPNLLLMGSEGIAVGMATKIPPHNLTEVTNALLAMIEVGTATPHPEKPDFADTSNLKELADSKTAQDITTHPVIDQLLAAPAERLAGSFTSELTIDAILTHIQGPDFPTAGIIYDFAAISEAYRTGKGKVVIRAKAEIVESKKGHQIIVTELPYQVNKARLLMKIAELVKNKKIEGIRDLNDDSDRNGLQVTIDLKREARPKVVLNKLYKYTELQTSFPVNMVALNSQGTPQLLNIKQILREFVGHRQLVVTRRTQHELLQARERAHILEGLLIALGHLDEVIEIIRRSPDSDTAKTRLMDKFGLSDRQAQAILDMQLKRLAALERQKIEDEYQQIKQSIYQYITLLLKPSKVLQKVNKEILEMQKEYGDERKTKLVKGKIGELSELDLIPNQDSIITLTESGYIKRMEPGSYRTQGRGGKGSKSITTKDEDTVTWLLTAKTHDDLLVFTNTGRVFKVKVFEIPESSRQAKGTAIVNLVNLQANETVQSLLLLKAQEAADHYITLATRLGLVKKTAINLYQNIRQNGIVAINLNNGDSLVWSKLTSGSDHLLVVSHNGKCIRFSETEVKSSNRDTKGVKAITLKAEDYVVGMEAFPAEPSQTKKEFSQLLLVTENGMGKRTELAEYPVQKRSGIGVKVAEITKRTGQVAAAMLVTQDHDELVLTTDSGQSIKMSITKKSVPVLTRPTQGVILMRLAKGTKISAATVTLKELE